MAVTAAALDRCPHCGALDIVARGERVECLHCKRTMHLADLAACPRCGDVLPSAAASCEHCASTLAVPGGGAAAGARRIGGWLLVLAVYLAGVAPLLFFQDLVRFMSAIGPGALSPALARFVWGAVAAEAAVAAAFAVGGFRLLVRRPGAIRYCKRVLLAAPVLGVLELVAAMRFGVLFDAALPAVALGMAKSALVTLGWLAYLHESKRVRETFPD